MVQAGDKCDFIGTLIAIPDVAQLAMQSKYSVHSVEPLLYCCHDYQPIFTIPLESVHQCQSYSICLKCMQLSILKIAIHYFPIYCAT